MGVLSIYEYKYDLVYIYNNKLLRKAYVLFNTRFLFDQVFNNLLIRKALVLSGHLDA